MLTCWRPRHRVSPTRLLPLEARQLSVSQTGLTERAGHPALWILSVDGGNAARATRLLCATVLVFQKLRFSTGAL